MTVFVRRLRTDTRLSLTLPHSFILKMLTQEDNNICLLSNITCTCSRLRWENTCRQLEFFRTSLLFIFYRHDVLRFQNSAIRQLQSKHRPRVSFYRFSDKFRITVTKLNQFQIWLHTWRIKSTSRSTCFATSTIPKFRPNWTFIFSTQDTTSWTCRCATDILGRRLHTHNTSVLVVM